MLRIIYVCIACYYQTTLYGGVLEGFFIIIILLDQAKAQTKKPFYDDKEAEQECLEDYDDDDVDEVEEISDERDEIHTSPLKELFGRGMCIYLYFSLCFYESCTYKIIP